VSEAENRKPQSDEARSAFDPEITSEFAMPVGLTVPRTGGESETTSEFAVPQGLDVGQPAAGEAANAGCSVGPPPPSIPPLKGEGGASPAISPNTCSS